MTELVMSQNIGEYERGVIEGYQKGYNACKQDLEKHGHWEVIGKLEPAYDIMGVKTWADEVKCSVCGARTHFIQGHGYYGRCFFCGAKMSRIYGSLAEMGFELTEDELHEFEKMLCKAFDENNEIITEGTYNELINKVKMDEEVNNDN